jgi:hypothetical protein
MSIREQPESKDSRLKMLKKTRVGKLNLLQKMCYPKSKIHLRKTMRTA